VSSPNDTGWIATLVPKHATTRVAQVAVFSVMNGTTILTQNQNFGAALGQPLTILQGRLVRAALQVKFWA
jgi:hypothetical protein